MDNQFTPVIGKDVIESLTIGMYEDSRFIFREYIQNAADQIDKAIIENLISHDQGAIHITIDPSKATISIEDNATGISQKNVQSILQNIAQSTKQRGVDKGFRGIGRLGGLAYCNKLIFETSFAGEGVRSRLTWDAYELKKIINNRVDKEDAVSVIKHVTALDTSPEESSAHYFRVILEEVSNPDLLDRKEVEKYLAMVAPLPFPTRFIFRPKIIQALECDNFSLDEYKIYLNTEQVFKGYSTYIYRGDENDRKKDDEIIDIAFFKEYASDGKLLFWGWHSISEKNQSLNQVNYTRGFRLRKSNIQVGDEFTLLKMQRDRRFHFYFFGEVHGVHPDLIPNSRRDYFTENEICFEFERKLKSFFHTQIYKLCYTASEINSSVRKIEDLYSFEEQFKKKQTNGFTDKKEHEEYKDLLGRKQEEAARAQKKIDRIELDATNAASVPIRKILDRVSQNGFHQSNTSSSNLVVDVEKPKFRTDNLSSLTKEQRKFAGRMFSIIRGVLDPQTAENLIQKIEEELK